jgi:hypothetical protein
MEIRWSRVITALILGAIAFSMANMVDRGVTRGWPQIARTVWAISLVGGVLIAAFLLANGLGILTTDLVADVSNNSSLTVRHFVFVYFGFLVLGVSGAFLLERFAGIEAKRGTLLVCGPIFVLASTARPWWLFATIRSLGWFGAIRSDKAMRMVLLFLGLILVAFGISAK